MNHEMLLDRSKAASPERITPLIGDILLHVQNDTGLEFRIQLALSLARATGAHLQCAQVTPIEAYVTTGTLGGLLALDKAMEKVDAEDAVLQSSIESRLSSEDVSSDYEHVTGYTTIEIIRRSALADLTIVGREAHLARAQRPQISVLGDILSATRTPLLIAGANATFDPFAPALIAWNGSIEAANATRSAIGLLKLASKVRVIRYVEDKDRAFPDIRLTRYLSRHDIHAELFVQEVRTEYAQDIVQHAIGYDAGMIVMGGYGHSRAGELLFGGVTRDLLNACPINVVIAH